MEIQLALFYPHQLLNSHPQKFPLFLVTTYFLVKSRFPWYGDTWRQNYIPLIPYQSTRLWTIGAKAQFRLQCSGDRWGGKGPDPWQEKGEKQQNIWVALYLSTLCQVPDTSFHLLLTIIFEIGVIFDIFQVGKLRLREAIQPQFVFILSLIRR